MTNKIKVLFLAANPLDAGYRPRLDKEVSEISGKIRLGEYRDSFDLISEWAIRPDTIQEALMRLKPDIVHFSGHGSKTQGIILEDIDGNMTPVSKNALAGLFRILKDNIRIIILNACYSKWQTEALKQTIDYTVGMNKAIGDKAAITFAASFYQALAFGRSVKESFELAKIQLELSGIPESKTPVLFVREGANAFLVKDEQSSSVGSERQQPGGPQANSRPESGGTVFNGPVGIGMGNNSGTINYNEKFKDD